MPDILLVRNKRKHSIGENEFNYKNEHRSVVYFIQILHFLCLWKISEYSYIMLNEETIFFRFQSLPRTQDFSLFFKAWKRLKLCA